MEIVSALAVSHAGCLMHAVSKATPMLLSHQHLPFLAMALSLYRAFPARQACLIPALSPSAFHAAVLLAV